MSFIHHSGHEDTPQAITVTSTLLWSEDRLRSELTARGVWPTSLPGNVENWYPRVLADVRAGKYTFEQFAEEFASQQPFDFGKTLTRLHESRPHFGGGWQWD